MRAIIGMDPHKRSATIEVIDQQARVLAAGTYDTDNDGYGRMLCAGRAFPARVWAIEGCNGIGKHLAHRLVHDGRPSSTCPRSCPRTGSPSPRLALEIRNRTVERPLRARQELPVSTSWPAWAAIRRSQASA